MANGDTGVIAHIDAKRRFLVVRWPAILLLQLWQRAAALTLAYAITVHKAQGGQADTVIAIVNGADHMLNAQSFYTALTNASTLYLFGDFRVLLARTQIYPMDTRHDLLGSLSGQLTVDNFTLHI